MSKPLIDQLKTRFSSDQWPHFRSAQTDGDACRLALHISAEICWFEGHFPGQPVLAGVVQTHWAGQLARFIFAVDGDFQRIDNLKFQTVVLPDSDIVLSLDFDRAANAVKFKFFGEESAYSQGKLVFSPVERQN